MKRVYKKEIDEGRVGIEFHAPPHQLLINADKSELRPFLELLYKLMDRGVMEKLEYIPILRQFSWRNSKTKSKSEPVYCSTCDSLLADSMCKKPKINVGIRVKKYSTCCSPNEYYEVRDVCCRKYR